MVKLNKKPAKSTSVKVGNKKQNKLNKQKQRTKKAAKNAKPIPLERNGKVKAKKANPDQELADGVSFVKDFFVDEEAGQEFKRRKEGKRRFEEDEEDHIESRYRVNRSLIKTIEREKKVKLALPIKTATGKLVQNYMAEDNSDEETVTEKEPVQEKHQVVVEEERPKTAMELIREKNEFFEMSKEKIAFLCRQVMSNPQEQMKRLKELRTMLIDPEVRKSFMLRKMIVVSLCEIFKDIMPSYKIRSWTEKENTQNISSEVKQLKEFEESLLKQYKLYLDYLSESLRGVHSSLGKAQKDQYESIVQFGLIAFRCYCQLIEKLSYFNFAVDIMEAIVNQLTSKIQPIAIMAFESIRDMFRGDKTLQLSLDITQKIAKCLKQKSYGVKPEVLDIFLHLKLKEIPVIEEEKAKKLTHKEKMKLSRTDRKKLKEKEQLEKDLEEKKLSDKLNAKSKIQTKILEQVFAIYFRILKKSANTKLIPGVLEGLAKFAHLINLDFFEDLLKLLHQMIESEDLSARSKLHIIKTVFVVLSGQGEALTLDPAKFYTSLYGLILSLDVAGGLENIYLLSDCVDMMFFKRRKQIPTARLLAFIKRLNILSLHLQPDGAAIVLHMLRKLINLNKQSDLLFDNEYQDSGIYNPYVSEPDHANAQNSALWEFHLLRRHYCTTIGNEASNLLKDTGITFDIAKLRPHELVAEMRKLDQLIFKDPHFKSQKKAK